MGTTLEIEESTESVQPQAPEPQAGRALSKPAAGESRYWIVLAVLVVAMAAQMWTSIRQLSITSDEMDHLHAGYRYLQCNDYGWNPEHPPLVKEIAAVPLLFMHINDPVPNACGLPNNKVIDFRVGHDFIFFNPESMLMRARMAASVFALALLVVTWLFARKMFGIQVATVAAVLIAFEPSLLGHGSLVTTDVPAALGITLALYTLYCYTVQRTFPRLIGVGLATGFAFCLKHSTVILVLILPVLLIGDALLSSSSDRMRRLVRAVGALALIGALAVVVLWASYGFRYSARPASATLYSNLKLPKAKGKIASSVVPALMHEKLLPEAYLAGLQDILIDSEFGRVSYLFGRLYWGGKAIYFPAAAMVKLTLPLLLLLLISAALWPFWKDHLRQLSFLALPTGVVFLTAASAGLNIGFRHVFAVIPLLVLFASAGAWSFWGRRKWAKYVVVGLLLWHAASSLHAYPNYISYANELFGGPANAYKYLSDSNVDWGQAQKMARDYVASKRPQNCIFIHSFNNFNSDYAIPCLGISELEHEIPPAQFTGTLIVSNNVLAGLESYAGGARVLPVFAGRSPVAKLGGSALLVYEGTFDLKPLVTEQRLQAALSNSESLPELASEIEAVVASDPMNARTHYILCDVYGASGQNEAAERECNLGIDLDYAQPGTNLIEAKQREKTLAVNGLRIYHPHQ